MGRAAEKIKKAVKTLGLEGGATMHEIREAYRELSLKYHPDKCRGKGKKEREEKFKEINNANKVLMEYCLSYRFTFDDEEHADTRVEKSMKDHMRRFYDGWWTDDGQ